MMRIAIGAITRDRPIMFGKLLTSLAALQVPPDLELIFVFAENGTRGAAEGLVSDFVARSGRTATYLHEPRLGIPFARNAVLNKALELGATHLAFIDDDEVAPPEWIGRLWRGMQQSGAGLVAGPVKWIPEDFASLGFWQRRVAVGMVAQNISQTRKRRIRSESGKASSIAIATNNWLCDLTIPRTKGLRFQEQIGLGSGSDTAFWHDFWAMGGQSSWVADAYVEETMPKSRLKPGYQLSRAASHAAAEWERRVKSGKASRRFRAWLYTIWRFVSGIVQVTLGTLVLPKLLYVGLRNLGRAKGRLSAMRTGRSRQELYRTIDGA